jgi:DNA-binding NarL/FixJ family response regulator
VPHEGTFVLETLPATEATAPFGGLSLSLPGAGGEASVSAGGRRRCDKNLSRYTAAADDRDVDQFSANSSNLGVVEEIVLGHLVAGDSDEAIARATGLSVSAIQALLDGLCLHYNVWTRHELVTRASAAGSSAGRPE